MNGQREEPAHWGLWYEKDDPAADGKGRRFRLKCSVCLTELACAIVFPEHGLRLCLVCLDLINAKVQAEYTFIPSGPTLAGPASLSVPNPSRDNTPSTEGER